MVIPTRHLLSASDVPSHHLFELAPVEWKKTSVLNEVHALLDANVFRRLTLDARG